MINESIRWSFCSSVSRFFLSLRHLIKFWKRIVQFSGTKQCRQMNWQSLAVFISMDQWYWSNEKRHLHWEYCAFIDQLTFHFWAFPHFFLMIDSMFSSVWECITTTLRTKKHKVYRSKKETALIWAE